MSARHRRPLLLGVSLRLHRCLASLQRRWQSFRQVHDSRSPASPLLTDPSIEGRASTSPDSSWLARSKAADCKPRQCAQTLSVAARTGGELNALHRHLQKGGGFADVDRGIDFSTCLPLTNAFDKRLKSFGPALLRSITSSGS